MKGENTHIDGKLSVKNIQIVFRGETHKTKLLSVRRQELFGLLSQVVE